VREEEESVRHTVCRVVSRDDFGKRSERQIVNKRSSVDVISD